jgi:RNA polymerase sigma-70 factor (ECF subfamily)
LTVPNGQPPAKLRLAVSSPTPSDPDLPRRRSEEAAASLPGAEQAPDADASDDRVGATDAAPPAENGGNSVNRGRDAASNREARRKEAAEDRVLIEAAQGGDRGAFRSLVERHQRRAFSIAFGLVRDENDARDIVQEAFLRVYRGLDTFEGSSSFFTWLYRIVTNLSIDLIRKPGRKAAAFDESRASGEAGDEERASMPMMARVDGADPVDVMRRKEIAGRIRSALEALPPYHRDVILLREIEGLSYEEMAEAMGVSKGTIMSRLFHARQKLQRALADCYDEQLGKRVPAGETAEGES